MDIWSTHVYYFLSLYYVMNITDLCPKIQKSIYFFVSKRTRIFHDSKTFQMRNRTDRSRNYFAAQYSRYLQREMRALILILNADPFATSAAPGVRRQGHAIACTADVPPTRVQTLDVHASRRIQKSRKGESERHGGALGASNPIWISTADRAAH